VPLSGWLLWAILAATLPGTDTDLDCARPDQARIWLSRLMLSEIEGAEDIHRAAMWEAFGRCAPSANGGLCRESERQRFEAQWERQKKEIEDKYRKMLSNFEERCGAAIAWAEDLSRRVSGLRAAS
jgi:hypothetical protein